MSNASLARTLFLRLQIGQPHLPVLVYPRTQVRGVGNCTLEVRGKLHLGCAWPLGTHFPSEIKFAPASTLRVAGEFRIFTEHRISINEGAVLSLGSGYINCNVTIDCFTSICIGDDVAIAKGVVIRDCDSHSIDGASDRAPIEIGTHVWLGMNATILKGVRVGDGAVVAAGAVVTRDVPPKCVVAGVPARVLKEGISWR